MLTPDYFFGKSDKLIDMYQNLEDWILQDIANRLVEAGSLSGTADRELWKIQQMGLHKQEIVKRISELTGKSRNEVRRLLKESVLTSFSDDKGVLERYMETKAPMQNNLVINAMNAELIKTFGELGNLTRTTIDQSQRDLLNMLNEVDFRVASGMQSYSSAVCEVLDRYANSGVVVNYPTGTSRSLEAAVRCCIVTSMNQTAAQVTNQYIVEAGIEYVLVSAHMGARHDKKHPESLESHDYWQGKVYKIRGADADAPNLLEATGYDIDPMTGAGRVRNPLGLHGYNCRHSHKPWDKSLRNPYVDENGNPKIDLHESQEMYEKQQQQRAMERSIRQTKRQLLMKEQEMSGFPNSPELQNEYDKLSYTLRLKNRKYGEFCAENDLQKQSDRIKVAGFKKEQASKANGRATAYQHSVKVPMEKGNNVGYTKRTQEEFEQTVRQIKEEITQYSERPSKWSGRIQIDKSLEKEKSRGAKEWNCDISVVDTANDGTLWHEMLHSCSCSYYDPYVYNNNEAIEETSVEWLTQQICEEKQIARSSAYEDQTIVLKALNNRFAYGTDAEFAKELFNIPLPERYQWLEDKVDASLRNEGASFADYNDVMFFLSKLKGAIK